MPRHPTPSTSFWGHATSALLLAALLCGTPHIAHAAASSPAPEAPSPKKKSNKVTIKPSHNNSAETRTERERRLKRECKGLPNAGACLGYAHPG